MNTKDKVTFALTVGAVMFQGHFNIFSILGGIFGAYMIPGAIYLILKLFIKDLKFSGVHVAALAIAIISAYGNYVADKF